MGLLLPVTDAELEQAHGAHALFDAHPDNREFGPPVHGDLVRCNLAAKAPNQVWLSDVIERWTGGGKLHGCAFKDVFCNRIVGHSIDSR